MKIDITKITNPIIRRALEGRTRDFMFNYGDNSHSDAGGEHTDITLFPRKQYDVIYNEYQEYDVYHDSHH